MIEAFTPTLALAFGLVAVVAYLLGSISFAVIVSTRKHKQDVRELGSGNAGMTNVLRSFGGQSAAITFIGDAGKGVLAVFAGRGIFLWLCPDIAMAYGAYTAGVFVLIGHMLPLFFHFKGGKGVATSCGVVFALQPVIGLILISIFGIIVATTKMVSLGSIVALILVPVSTFVYVWLFQRPAPVYSVVCSLIIAAMVVWGHRGNIARIRSGTEYRFGQGKTKKQG